MANELAAILGVAAPTAPPVPAAAKGARMDPSDAMIRTAYAELGPLASPQEYQWVAATIANRAKATGKDWTDVVQEPDQYEPWSTPSGQRRINSLKPDQPIYKQIAGYLKPVMDGEDPSGGVTHFYHPETQAKLGREKPDFDDGSGIKIGGALFFRPKAGGPKGSVAGDELANVLGLGAAEPPASAAPQAEPHDPFNMAFAGDPNAPSVAVQTTDGKVLTNRGEPLTDAQAKARDTLIAAGQWDDKAEGGAPTNVFIETATRPAKDAPKGSFYMSRDGKIHQVPDGEKSTVGESLGAGAVRGVLDVGQSIGGFLPGAKDSDVGQKLEANRLIYDATHEGDIGAKTGRFAGQLASSLPVLGAGGKLLGAGAKVLGPAGEFIMGEGGGNLTARVGSKLVAGAGEGAGQSALVSGANDEPTADDLLTGAVFGAAAKPLGAGANKLGKAIFGNGSKAAAPAAEQVARYAKAENLPVRVPMTRGQITGNPEQQMLENSMLRGAEGPKAAEIMQAQAAETQEALRGNVGAISSKLAGGRALERGEGGAAAQERLVAMRKTAEDGVNAAYKAARESDQGASIPREFVPVMAQAVREAVSDVDMGGAPNVARLLETLDRPISARASNNSTRGDKVLTQPLEVRDLFELRQKLTSWRGTQSGLEPVAAAKAVGALDKQIEVALEQDLIHGDPAAVKAWKEAISKRRDVGKLFEGRDLIQSLTEEVRHGEGMALKVSPQDAANYIFNRANLGAVGKKDLTRDMIRLRDVLGEKSPEWSALRGESFARLARAGEGAPEGGSAQFSGQNFFKAWDKFKADDPQLARTLFSAEERKLIDDFAEVAQRATTPVKGGDNPSNSAIAGKVLIKKALESLGTMLGGAAGSVGGPGGAAVGAGVGKGFDAFMKDVGAAMKARKAVSPDVPKVPKLKSRLIPSPVLPAVVLGGQNLLSGGASSQ